jgi:dTDP-4-amino-4,6-dideoxygalactose transaminase
VDDPARVTSSLRAEGFDASNLPRSRTVAAPADRPKLEPHAARDALARLVVLPCYPAMPLSELERQAGALERALASGA